MLLRQNLGEPIFTGEPRYGLGIFLGERDKIAVVIMPHILVVNPGHRAAFVFGPFVTLVMFHHHIHTIGIVAGDHHIYNIVQPFQFQRILGGA